MAYEAFTMPGNVATFATCWTARSWMARSMSSSEANTMPGTRIPSTEPTGIRQTYGSIWSASTRSPPSNIQEHADLRPPRRALFHPELVIGGRFHGRAVGLSHERGHLDARPHAVPRGDCHADIHEAHLLCLVQPHQLVQEVHQ